MHGKCRDIPGVSDARILSVCVWRIREGSEYVQEIKIHCFGKNIFRAAHFNCACESPI